MTSHQLQPLPHGMVVVLCRMMVGDQPFFCFASCGVGSTPVINHVYTLHAWVVLYQLSWLREVFWIFGIYQLHVYRVVMFPVDVFVLVNGRVAILTCVQSTQPVTFGKVRHSMEHNFHGIRLALWVETNVSRHKASEGCSHSVNNSRNGCLANTK